MDHFALVTTAAASLGAGNELLAHDHFAIYLPHGINDPALAGPSASWEAGLFGAAEFILCQRDAVCVCVPYIVCVCWPWGLCCSLASLYCTVTGVL